MAELDGRRDVYISGLPKDVDDAMLKEIFQPYGEVTWCRALPRDGKARQAQATGASGLVEFGTPEQAAWVVQNMKGSVPTGLTEPIEVKFKDDPNTRWGGKGGAGKGLPGAPGAPASTTVGLANWLDSWDDDAKSTWSNGTGSAPMGMGMGMGTPKHAPITVPPRMIPAARPLIDHSSDNVYIRNLPGDLPEDRLKEIFGAFGTIMQVKLMTGGTKQTALIRFSSVDEARAVVSGVKNTVLPGLTEQVEAKFADTQQKPQRYAGDGTPFGIDTIVRGFQLSGLMPGGTGYQSSSEHALYIAGLPPDTTDYYLYRLFSPLGAIAPKGVRTMTNEDGTCKGIAFVNYLDQSSAHMAITIYNGTVMPDGQRLKVQIKVQKPAVTASPLVIPAPVKAAAAALLASLAPGGVLPPGGVVPPGGPVPVPAKSAASPANPPAVIVAKASAPGPDPDATPPLPQDP